MLWLSPFYKRGNRGREIIYVHDPCFVIQTNLSLSPKPHWATHFSSEKWVTSELLFKAIYKWPLWTQEGERGHTVKTFRVVMRGKHV